MDVQSNRELKSQRKLKFLTGLTGYDQILYILYILSKDLIETKKITYIDIEMRL